jgi:hypothetical protein
MKPGSSSIEGPDGNLAADRRVENRHDGAVRSLPRLSHRRAPGNDCRVYQITTLPVENRSHNTFDDSVG